MVTGVVVILNGPPRSGKSSIAAAIQTAGQQPWTAVGVDSTMAATPGHLHPGIGLRPGGERPDLEDHVVASYRDLFATVAAHSEQGRNVVVDVGIHDAYSRPLGIWVDLAVRLSHLNAYVVGVRCALEVIVMRRAASPDRGRVRYESQIDGRIAEPVIRWQRAVHDPGHYDLVVDTTNDNPQRCAETVLDRIDGAPPKALGRWLPTTGA